METTERTFYTSRQKRNPMTERRLFLLLFMGLVLSVTDASCPIELTPSKVVVKYGDPVSVNCSTTETSIEGLGWEVSQGGIGLTNVTSLTWTVKSVKNWGMEPICYISSPEHQCTASLGLVIYTFPESISISSNSPSEMTEGMKYNLTCNIHNIAPLKNLTVRWYKGDTIINQTNIDNDSSKPQPLSPYYYFTPTRNDSNSTLRCEAHMDLGPEGPLFSASSQEYHIKEVRFGPDIECSSLELREEETLEEKCRVTGNPTPHVEWLKEGHLVNVSVPLRRNDAGTYTVKAEGLTLVQKNIMIDVLYGPEWRCPHLYTTTENYIHNLNCSLGFPKPNEIWFKDEEEVELPQMLTRSNAGQYRVLVSNALSVHNYTMDIKILYPPTGIFELKDAEVNAGENLGLKCSSVAYPKPNYTWSYFQEDNVKEETEDGVSRLIIHSATGYNMGSYTCRAWTEQGSASKTVRVTVTGTEVECPIEISPKEVVLQYQSGGLSVECKSKTNEMNVKEIFWRTRQGVKMLNTSWVPDTYGDWDPQPVCHGEFIGIGRCFKELHYTLYKTPESISIKVSNSTPPMEGTELQLQCDIISVAPAQNLTVLWTFYRGNETIEPLANASCDFSSNGSHRSPVNVSCTMNITLERFHNGIEVQCRAELNLGATGPQLPDMMSSIANINVLYEPKINITKLPETVLVFKDSPEELVCEADGNPRPTISWEYASETAILKSEGKLVVDDAGFYNCVAVNRFNSTIQVVKVILIEDYLPLIAGFVALTVVIISVVFLFIYSIYYKNTKMRHYSLKNPKFSSESGNVAHNGWDIQLPVTKMS